MSNIYGYDLLKDVKGLWGYYPSSIHVVSYGGGLNGHVYIKFYVVVMTNWHHG